MSLGHGSLPYNAQWESTQAHPAWLGHDTPHAAFWDAVSAQQCSTESIVAYSRRCFLILVAWLVIIREAACRDAALGISMYHAPNPIEQDLARFILVHIRYIHITLSTPEGEEYGAMTFVPPQLSSSSVPADTPHAMLIAPHRQGDFLRIPAEVHLHICGYLSFRSKRSMVTVCRQLYSIVTPLLYAEPLLLDAKRSQLFVRTCKTQPKLHAHLQHAHATCSVHNDHQTEVEHKDSDFPPLSFALHSNIRKLETLSLYPKDLNSIVYALPQIAKRWPQLAILRTGGTRVDSPSHNPDLEVETLSVNQNLCGFIYKGIWESTPNFNRRLILRITTISAHTLTHLCVNSWSIISETTNTRAFPVLPHVQDAKLQLDVPSATAETFLQRCFPAVSFLYIYRGPYDGPVEDTVEKGINFA